MSYRRFALLILALQVAFIILFAIFAEYGAVASPPLNKTHIVTTLSPDGLTPEPEPEPVINDLKDYYAS